MNVIELREALQKLEADGKGGLPVAVRVDFNDRCWLETPEPRIEKVGWHEADSGFPEGAVIVRL